MRERPLKKKKRFKTKAGKRAFIALLSVFSLVFVIAGINLIRIYREYAMAQMEYEALREFSLIVIDDNDSEQEEEIEVLELLEPQETEELIDQLTPMLERMSEINPDFIGWIFIDGTVIHYPVVQGRDNNRYMNTTFAGVRNPAGTIFMDYRSVGGFDAPLAVIYGHNMRNGTMFSDLRHYMRRAHMEEFPYIVILTKDGEEIRYRIFSAGIVGVFESIYPLIGASEQAVLDYIASSNAPPGTRQILALSTCTADNDEDVRLLILAARI
jgi:sortase B